ncbi:hypothetical protein [Sporosarcina sp. SAFN-015]|uniref:hypothetical protein n=1 Tax=Sporosarcina sp. SAFN-015 TaxID=3387274 RepID=UPI003F80A254
MGNGNLCFSCFDDITFQYHGYNAEKFQSEINRYTNAIYEGLTVNCSLCGRTAKYNRDEPSGKWQQTYEEAVG